MLELDLQVHKTRFETKLPLERSFTEPIIFYLKHKNDKRNFLISFVILDFQKKEATYMHSYSEKNEELVKKSEFANVYSLKTYKPHATIKFPQGEMFYNFRENESYFYLVDPNNKKISIIGGKDIPVNKNKKITKFGSTFFVDDNNPNYFYFSALFGPSGKGSVVRYFRSSLDLKEITFLYEHLGNICPHTTRKYKNTILNSKFSNVYFKHISSGKTKSVVELYEHVYGNLFAEYMEMMGEAYSHESFLDAIKINNEIGSCVLRPDFEMYVKSIFGEKSFLEICDSRVDFQVVPENGEITCYDLETKKISSHETSIPTPAHFEIDEKNDQIYVSAHNFVVLNNQKIFLGPAAIDRFAIKNGELKYEKSFTHPKGYRYTSHKVFHFQGQPYVCTIGKPNRLFIIDGESMKLSAWYDLGNDFLSNISNENIIHYLNQPQLIDSRNEFIALEVSNDGNYIWVVGGKELLIYSMETNEIVEKIQFLTHGEEVYNSPLEFEAYVTHCQQFV